MRFQLDSWNGPICSVKYSICGASLPRSPRHPILATATPSGAVVCGAKESPLLSRSGKGKSLSGVRLLALGLYGPWNFPDQNAGVGSLLGGKNTLL